jgi:surface antigen
MKNKVSHFLSSKVRVGVLVLAAAIILGGSLLPGARSALADSFQDQINSLNQQNADAQGAVSGLQAQAASYQDAINQLQQQISSLQTSIDSNTAQQASLQQQIVDTQTQIDHEKSILASDVKAMYVDGTPSTLEVLATSKNLSDFVDKQEYRTTVQSKLQDLLTKIANLQKQLQSQKAQVDQLLKEEQFQQDQLSSAQAQQAQLLSYNEGQQAAYNAQISANTSKISQLRAQQAAANSKLGTGLFATGNCGGGYPAAAGPGMWGGTWGCSYGQDNTADNWGMYNRECVSYTAFKAHQAYGYNPIGWGNANQWPGNARASGLRVDSDEEPGTVAIWDVGYYGHAMWVEAVNGDGSIIVSQFNYSYNGTYSEMKVSASQAATFHYIHFN